MNFAVAQMVGDKFARDHQYWPTILRSEIPSLSAAPDPSTYDTIWPVDITLDQLLALALRARNYDFSGNCTVSKSITDSITTTQSGVANIAETQLTVLKQKPDFSLIGAEKETDIIARPIEIGYKSTSFKGLANYSIGAPTGDAPRSVWSTSGDIGNFNGTTPASGVGAINPIIFSGFPVLYNPATQKFSPPFNPIGIMIPATGQILVSVAFNRHPQTILSGTAPLLLRKPGVMSVVLGGIADDFDVPVELQWRFQFEFPGSHVSGTGDCDFTLEATDWWPFRNSLGQLVYNASDGQQIADPFA